jgi:3-hydroxymyristoyl/3-hydroxydecanoyl-(acyl carrier protein) dehydratase
LLNFTIPAESPYFDGHFPEFKIFPAVAQFDLTVRLASRYLGTGINVERIKRMKFSDLIRPEMLLCAELTFDASSRLFIFKITSPDRKTVYSSGTVVMAGSY